MVLQCINGVGSKSRRGKNKNLTALISNSNTVWFNFQTYMYIYIYIERERENKDEQLSVFRLLLYVINKCSHWILFTMTMHQHRLLPSQSYIYLYSHKANV